MRVYGFAIVVIFFAACGLFKKKTSTQTQSLKYDSNAIKAMYYQAELDYELGNFGQAAAGFQKFVNYSANKSSGYFRLASIAIKQNSLDNALNFINQAIELEPRNTDFLYCKVGILEKKRKFALASEEIKKIIAIKPKYYLLYKNAIGNYLQEKNTDAALAVARNWENQFGVLEEIANIKIKIFDIIKSTDSVENEYKKLIKKYPERRQYKQNYANYLIGIGKSAKAAEILSSLDAGTNATAETFSQRCNLYQSEKNANAWFTYLKTNIGNKKISSNQRASCAWSFMDANFKGYEDSIVNLLEILVTENSDLIETKNKLANYFLSKLAYNKACNLYKSIVLDYKNNLLFCEKFVETLIATSQLNYADKFCDTLIETFPVNYISYLLSARVSAAVKNEKKASDNISQAFSYAIENGEKDNCIEAFCEVFFLLSNKTKLASKLSEIIDSKAWGFVAKNYLNNSDDKLIIAFTSNNNVAADKYNFGLAFAYYNNGMYSKAQLYIDKLVQLNGTNALYLSLASAIYGKLGDVKKSAKYFNSARELNINVLQF